MNYPDQLDYVLIPPAANQPVVSTNSALRGFGVGSGGGTITVNGNVSLNITQSTDSIRSDVVIRGATNNCSNCIVRGGTGGLQIVDDAWLTLGKGIGVQTISGFGLTVGSASSEGNFRTTGGSVSAEMPWMNTGNSPAGGLLRVAGPTTGKSTVEIDGLRLSNNFGTPSNLVTFAGYFSISKLDNLEFTNSAINSAGNALVRFTDCTGSDVSSTNLINMKFTPTITAGFNIHSGGTNCSSLPNISLTGYSGPGACGAVGAGACALENDPNNKFSWD